MKIDKRELITLTISTECSVRVFSTLMSWSNKNKSSTRVQKEGLPLFNKQTLNYTCSQSLFQVSS